MALLRLDARNKFRWEKTKNGLIRAYLTLGIAGKELKYFSKDSRGSLRERLEFIAEEELFNEDSLETAYGLPMTLHHPKRGMFEQNREGILVGSLLQEFVREDGALVMPAVIHDRRGIELIESAIAQGLQAEVSPGYWIEDARLATPLIEQDFQHARQTLEKIYSRGDVPKFEQIGRRYDHIALLMPGEGRGGKEISLRMDAAAYSPDFELEGTNEREDPIEYGDSTQVQTFFVKKPMKTFILDSVGYEVDDDDLFSALTGLKAKHDALAIDNSTLKGTAQAAETKAIELKERVDSLTSENQELKTKLEELEGEGGSSNDAIASDRKDCLEAWMVILPALRKDKKDYEPDLKLSSAEVKALYLGSKYPDLRNDISTSDLHSEGGKKYIESLWKVLKPTDEQNQGERDRQDAADKTSGQLAFLNLATQTEMSREDAKEKRRSARQRHTERIENAWKESAN